MCPDTAEQTVTSQDHTQLKSLIESTVGRTPARLQRIPAGLGTRRFYRIHFDEGAPETLIARIEDDGSAPSSQVDVDAKVPSAPRWLPEPTLEPIRTRLEQAGIRVPKSYARRIDPGIDILEDVGDLTLADVPPSERPDAYLEACQMIPKLQNLTGDAKQIPAFGRRFDRALIETKAWKWLHWTIPLLLGREASEAETETCNQLFGHIADLAEKAPLRLSHRDYKAENLHWLPNSLSPRRSDAGSRLVMIDVQGAFLAPPEYDLVCLLYDLQVELDETFVSQAFEATLPRLPDAPTLAKARTRFDALAIARLCKDISHVVHACYARGDIRRWPEIPRGLTLIERAAERLRPVLPEAEPLISVIQVLTPAVESADSRIRG
jgi:aminoglycoside/choline kinase family phosphotransferase